MIELRSIQASTFLEQSRYLFLVFKNAAMTLFFSIIARLSSTIAWSRSGHLRVSDHTIIDLNTILHL